jgi:MFS family permease
MLPVYARNVLGQGAAGYGGLMAAVGVGAGSGAIAMAAVGRRMDPLRVIRGGSLLFAASLAITMLHVSYLLAVVGLALAGLGSVLAAISTNSLLQTESPDHLRGRVMGFYSFVVLGLAPFGSLQAGFISEQFGVRVCLVIGAIICGLAVLLLLPREVTVPVRDET